jgi:iron complex transport system ATP-binding protein
MRLEGIGFEAGGQSILKNLAFEFPDRGVSGLIGKSGSGKSTLLKILARQQMPTRGVISFEGKPLASWKEREFAQRVAYLPQYTPLAAGLTVRELVELGRYPWHGALGRFSAKDREKVDEALSLTSTNSFADRFVDTLSGGERQRVWLAMLIAQDAKLLLLDEPISSLDVAHQVGMMKLVNRLSRERGAGVIVVIHEINMAARFCDQLFALKSGQLIAQGPAEGFMQPERLQEIYDVAMGVVPTPDIGGAIAYVRE